MEAAPYLGGKSVATDQLAAPIAHWPGASTEQVDLGEGWYHVFRGGRAVQDTTFKPIPILSRSQRCLSF